MASVRTTQPSGLVSEIRIAEILSGLAGFAWGFPHAAASCAFVSLCFVLFHAANKEMNISAISLSL